MKKTGNITLRGQIMERFMRFIIPILWLSVLAGTAAGADKVYLYLEGENYTSATANIKKVRVDDIPTSSAAQKDAQWFIDRSGLDKNFGSDVSNAQFVQVMEDSLKESSTNKLAYGFCVPETGTYYIWIRCNSVPPCYRRFSMWVDTLEPGADELIFPLTFAYWNIWSWWPWGYNVDRGKAKPYILQKGKHTLYVGYMNKDLKIDKLLITSDPEFRPYGLNQEYYSHSFEPPTIVDAHTRARGDQESIPATGWRLWPQKDWKVTGDILGNHYLHAHQTADAQADNPALALIAKNRYTLYDASLRFNVDNASGLTDVRVYSSHQDARTFECITLEASRLRYIKKAWGRVIIEREVQSGQMKRNSWHTLEVHRRRTSLCVELDSSRIARFETDMPLSGRFGVGSSQGGVGFDDIVVNASDDPEATFSFSGGNEPAHANWNVVSGPGVTTWTATSVIGAGDLLCYRVQPWSNSQLDLELTPATPYDFSVLFPFRSPRKYLGLRIVAGNGALSLEVRRMLDGQEKKISLETRHLAPKQNRLCIQSINGLYAVFLNGESVYEQNEYDIVEGTLGFTLNSRADHLPLTVAKITRKDMVYDSFPLGAKGGLNPAWTVVDGRWQIAAAMEGATQLGDGQLTAKSPGTLHIGKREWLSTDMQIAADFGVDPDFALQGWVDLSGWIELHCKKGAVEVRKIKEGIPLVMGRMAVPSLKDGWHKINFLLGKTGVTGRIDGKEVIKVPCPGARGPGGIKNYGPCAVFDNLCIQVIDTERGDSGVVRAVDTSFVDIEKSLIK